MYEIMYCQDDIEVIKKAIAEQNNLFKKFRLQVFILFALIIIMLFYL